MRHLQQSIFGVQVEKRLVLWKWSLILRRTFWSSGWQWCRRGGGEREKVKEGRKRRRRRKEEKRMRDIDGFLSIFVE